MRLTSLQGENILSFGTFKLPFETGLNVIVGPNGAGKSNVVRAVRMVRTALDIALRARDSIDVTHQLRLGVAEQRGVIRLALEFSEDDERELITTYVRALVTSSLDRAVQTTPSVDSLWEQQVAARAREGIDSMAVGSLLRGRLVLLLQGAPVSFSLAYEFDHAGHTYHYGLYGPGATVGWVGYGPFIATRRSGWGGEPLDFTAFLVGDEPKEFSFSDLLPTPGRTAPWEIKKHPSGEHLMVTEDLARALDVPIDGNELFSLASVLRHIVGDRLVLTENLRRPPRTVYKPFEVGPPVALDDAGDLPLELYRRSISMEPAERGSFRQVQRLFEELTGQHLEITVGHGYAAPTQRAGRLELRSGSLAPEVSETPEPVLRIRPVVTVPGGDLPVENAGAGVWEALVACTHAAPVPGRVVLLDEPANTLHPTWQRSFLSHLGGLNQSILVTHSPYLVPGDKVDDLDRITRLYPGPVGTQIAHTRGSAVPLEWKVRWRQSLVRWIDTRALLFARGVILVEGDSELGVFGHWFSREPVLSNPELTYDALNLQFFDVASDRNFGAHVSLLNAFGIPWSIICDGPVLSPRRDVNLIEQLRGAGLRLRPPAADAPFATWKKWWEKHGVYTVADRFGETNKSGEIEAFYARIDDAKWQRIQREYPKSKTRAGYAFAEDVDLSEHPEHLRELRRLWEGISKHSTMPRNTKRITDPPK